jgi:hypothetical protein
MNQRLWTFAGGKHGQFSIDSVTAVRGEPLPTAPRLDVTQRADRPRDATYVLRGVVSNERYVNRGEKGLLVSKQEALGRAEATCSVLIPIKKSEAWWGLSQDERRAIFEDQSNHIALGMKALPQVARRLHHCRDLGEDAPFDFLTWFDFQPRESAIFDDLLGALRTTEEWQFVEREVEIRVTREPGTSSK